jgi:hypothetical protein
VRDGEDPDQAASAVDRVDDAKTPDSLLPQAIELSDQRDAQSGIRADRTKRLLDGTLHVGRKMTNDFGYWRRQLEPEHCGQRRILRGRSGIFDTRSNWSFRK